MLEQDWSRLKREQVKAQPLLFKKHSPHLGICRQHLSSGTFPQGSVRHVIDVVLQASRKEIIIAPTP